MPPEGYRALTVPEDLAREIDDVPGDSHAAKLRHLLAEYYRADGGVGDAESVELTRSAVDDIATETASRVSQELEQSLR